MKTVGIAELKARLSENLQAVRRGETITVLDRREPVARIVPVLDAVGELVVRAAKGSLSELPVPGPVRHAGDIVEDLLRDRRERE
jgi:prevent-host-death family protein